MSGTAYRPEIDGLRAIAVTAVVLYHASAGLLPGGFIGVDVFFVISGYLITSILVQEWRGTGRIDLLAFYARRVRRLLPALAVVLVATVAVAAVLLPRLGRFQEFAESAIASVLFIANIYFDLRAGGYFDPAMDSQPLLHLWSLAVEEQFYLVYPLLLAGLFRLVRVRPLVVLGVLSLVSLFVAEYWLGVSPDTAFYQMPARFWELAVGGMIALGASQTQGERRATIQAGLGLALIVLSASLLQQGWRFPGLGALSSVAGAGLVLHAVHHSPRLGIVGRMLSLRPMVLLGLVSYPLYLWHWPILTLDQETRLAPADTGWRLMLCLVAVLLAWLTYRFVEMPVRRSNWTAGAVLRRGTLGSTAVLVAILGLTTINLGAEGSDLVTRTRQDRPADMARCHFDQSDTITHLSPGSCGSQPGRDARLAIWGDSHALAWKPLAWLLAQQAGVAAEAHTMDACPPVPGYRGHLPAAPGFGENCAAFNALVRQRIEARQYDTLILAARWPAHLDIALFSEHELARRSRTVAESPSPSEITVGLRDTLAMASRHARRVLVIGPTPVLRFDAPDCIGTSRLSECTRPRDEYERLVLPARQALLTAAAGLPNVQVIDPTDFFCSATECPAVKDGYGLFWDDDHVSSTAAKAFAAELAAEPARFELGGVPVPANNAK
ncbi:acyltransferase [Arenimonas soli]|uniref:Acyltransferase n=1 Tax=Arenimonas soli TaxID=2269504 RepID=A0ABQ1HPD5_9GAMM|nr:acyltransferase family protein [Arenimonas soli]GGA85169.1 acyltransferase [Arenimonas soli]